MAASDQHLYIHLNRQIYQFDQDGDWIRSIELKDLGIDTLTALQVREESLLLGGLGGVIKQCNLATLKCKIIFQDPRVDGTFKFYLDQNWLYVSDTVNHQILLYDVTQRTILQTYDKDLRYPNQISKIEQTLYVADTDHHRILALELGPNHRIGNAREVIGAKFGCRFPVSFVKSDQQWWILVAGRRLKRGKINIVNQKGLVDSIALPGEAHPLFLQKWQESILISDDHSMTLSQIHSTQKDVQAFGDSRFQQTLHGIREMRNNNLRMSRFSLLLLFLSGSLLIFYAGRHTAQNMQSKFQGIFSKLTPARLQVAVPSDYFQLNPEFEKKLRRDFRIVEMLPAIILFLMMGLLSLVFTLKGGQTLQDKNLLGLVLISTLLLPVIVILSRWVKGIFSIRMFTQGNRLYLVNTDQFGIEIDLEHIFYTPTHILAGPFVVPYRNLQGVEIIHDERFQNEVLTKLLPQHKLNAGETLVYQIVHMNKRQRFFLGLVFSLLAVLIAVLFNLNGFY